MSRSAFLGYLSHFCVDREGEGGREAGIKGRREGEGGEEGGGREERGGGKEGG